MQITANEYEVEVEIKAAWVVFTRTDKQDYVRTSAVLLSKLDTPAKLRQEVKRLARHPWVSGAVIRQMIKLVTQYMGWRGFMQPTKEEIERFLRDPHDIPYEWTLEQVEDEIEREIERVKGEGKAA